MDEHTLRVRSAITNQYDNAGTSIYAELAGRQSHLRLQRLNCGATRAGKEEAFSESHQQQPEPEQQPE